LRKDEGRRVAGVIVSLYALEKKGLKSALRKLDHIKPEVDYMWRIVGAGPEKAGTYLLFKLID
jgi:hypothetical protein